MNLVFFCDSHSWHKKNPPNCFIPELKKKGIQCKIQTNLFKVFKAIKEKELIISMVFLSKNFYFLTLLKHFINFKLIVFTDYDFNSKLNSFQKLRLKYSLKLLNKANKIVCWTNAEKQFFIKQGINERKLFVVPICIDFEFINSIKAKKLTGFNYCVLANFSSKKNVEIILRFLPENTNLYLLGNWVDEWYERKINELIYELNLQERVYFIENKPYQELISYLKGCNVFINASFSESFCIPLIEARASNLEILTVKTLPLIENSIKPLSEFKCSNTVKKLFKVFN